MKKKVLYSMMIVLLVITSFLIGMLYGNNKVKAVEGPLSSNVAVVNNDQGVDTKKGRINYGTEFLNVISKDVDYQLTSLSDAKSGLADNTYSGYLIIPENFSKTITNVNNNLEKVMVIYDINQNNSNVVTPTLTEINDIVNRLDQLVGSGYIKTLLNDVNDVTNNINGVINNIEQEKIMINGINNLDYIQPIELKDAQIQALDDAKLRESLVKLGLIDDDIINQLTTNILTNENEYRKSIDENILVVSDEIKQLENKQYFQLKLSSLELINGYNLTNEDGSLLEIVIDRNSAKLYVKQLNPKLVVKNDKIEYPIVGAQNNSYINIKNIENKLVEYIGDDYVNILNIDGDQIKIYGKQVSITKIDNEYQFTNCKKIQVNNDAPVYPDQSTGRITITVTEKIKSNDDIENQIKFNKLSAVIISNLTEIRNANPEITIDEAFNQIINNQEIINYFSNTGIEYSVDSYINTISETLFDYGLSQHFAHQQGTNEPITINSRRVEVNESGPVVVDNQLFAYDNITGIENQVVDLNYIAQLTSTLASNLYSYEDSITKSINYQFVAQTGVDISDGVDLLITQVDGNVSNVESTMMENTTTIMDYISNIQKTITDNTNSIITTIDKTSSDNIDQLTKADQGINYVKDGDTVDDNVVNFMLDNVDAQIVGSTPTKTESRKDNKKWIILGLAGVSAGLMTVIYLQNKKNKDDNSAYPSRS